MNMSESEELQIQRCVDGELSSSETRELLRRLDSLKDGWKNLACLFLEGRNLQSAILSPFDLQSQRADRASLAPEPLTPLVRRSNGVNNTVRLWWSHPITSLTLCAAIAFVGGMLLPDIQRQNGMSLSGVRSQEALQPLARRPLAQSVESGGYRLQMQPGGQSIDVPVVSDMNELQKLDRQHPLFSDLPDGKLKWMVFPVEGNKSMLIPVSEDVAAGMQ